MGGYKGGVTTIKPNIDDILIRFFSMTSYSLLTHFLTLGIFANWNNTRIRLGAGSKQDTFVSVHYCDLFVIYIRH